jgi:cytoplasmic FMR1 interacting protein
MTCLLSNGTLQSNRRASSFFPREQTEQEQMELPTLAYFIATQDQLAMDIKKALSTINSSVSAFYLGG